MNYETVIVSILVVTAGVIAYVTRQVDKCFDDYFDQFESRD